MKIKFKTQENITIEAEVQEIELQIKERDFLINENKEGFIVEGINRPLLFSRKLSNVIRIL
jgi:hypothetical protein